MTRVSEEPGSTRTRPRSQGIHAADGAASSVSADSDKGDCVVPLDSTIYISILDPVGEPAFKPSSTKPIPKWMQRSSPQHRMPRQAEPRPVSILDDHFQDVTPAPARHPTPPEPPKTVCPTTPSPPPPRHRITPRRPHLWPTRISGSRARDRVDQDIPQISVTVPVHNTSFVTSPPLKRPSSRLVAQTASEGAPYSSHSQQQPAHSQDTDLYLPSQIVPRRAITSHHGINEPTTAIDYHVPPQSRRTPTQSSEPGIGGNDREGSPRSVGRPRTPIGNMLHGSSSPLAEAVLSGLQRIVGRSRTPPPQSKEYLTLYRPTTAIGSRSPGTGAGSRDVTDSSPSIGVAGRKRARRVEREEFDHMIRAQVPDIQGDSGGGQEDTPRPSGGRQLKSTKRRSSLQVELRKLFSRGAT
ncbi:hypothetical protein PG988_009382 [Apiospora saccharicola]